MAKAGERNITGSHGSASKEEASDHITGKDEEMQGRISGQDGIADVKANPERVATPEGKSEAEIRRIKRQADESEKDLSALQREEFTGSTTSDFKSVGLSDTDEDEDEGLGDGKLGHTRGGLEK